MILQTRTLLLTATALTCSGCSPVGYIQDRGRDVADCFTLSAGPSLGLAADVKATDYCTLIGGVAWNGKVGFVGRDVGMWQEVVYGFPPFGGLRAPSFFRPYPGASWWPVTESAFDDSKGISRWDATTFLVSQQEPILCLSSFSTCHGERRPWIDRFNVQAGGTAGIVNARVGFSPGQFLDLILGAIGIDLAKDDRSGRERFGYARPGKW